jgi:hypothetical protein
MKGKTLLILLLAAGLLVALAMIQFKDRDNTAGPKLGAKLFPQLPVNQVAAITVADADTQTTLVKGDTVWQVKERSGYPANFDAIKDTVIKLSRLKIGRSFAGSPESVTRLELLSPSTEGASASGTLITLKDASGTTLADVILGQTRQTEDGGMGGQYLKKADDDTVYLVDGNFRFLKTAPAEWLKKEILNIKGEAVESVTCYTADSQSPEYILSRPEKGQDADMTPVPQGRTADPVKIEQVLDALAPLTLDDVRPAAAQPPAMTSGRQRLVYQLYDGRQISIFPEFDGKENHTVRVRVKQTAAAPQPVDPPETPAADGATSKEKAVEPNASATQAAHKLDEALRPWIFSIKKWQFDSFFSQATSLLADEKQDAEDAS